MSAEIEPLLVKLSSLAPVFGRLREDIDTMVSRGRTGDFKGVMQNARLVLEALLRSLVTEDLKQTPGKAMLDELVTKFRQQANAGIIPTNVLAHMGTVQAWGNLSSHDHAGGLGDEGVRVGEDEVIASLNSVAAVLSWYAAKKGLVPPQDAARATPLGVSAATANRATLAPPPVVEEKPKRSLVPLAVGGGLLACAIAFAGGWVLLGPTLNKPSKAERPFETLDALYASWKEPVPPAACRKAEDARRLAQTATDLNALSLIETPAPEAAYLLARATFEQKKQKSPALQIALQCKGFAAAENLAGDLALASEDVEGARTHLAAAVAAAPTFLSARAKLAGLLARTGKLDEALAETDAIITADPEFGAGYLLRSAIHEQQGVNDQVAADLCTAARLGSSQAKAIVQTKGLQCPAK